MRAFRIVIAAHGDLAGAFLSAASIICGPIDELHAVGLQPDDSPESFGSAWWRPRSGQTLRS